MTHPAGGPTETEGERKFFFSEENRQKTVDFSGVCAAWNVRDSIKYKTFGTLSPPP